MTGVGQEFVELAQKFLSLGVAAAPEDLAGQHRGTAESGDARLAVLTRETPPAGIESDGSYLAVSVRTPHNGLVLPAMALEATLVRDGETAFLDMPAAELTL